MPRWWVFSVLEVGGPLMLAAHTIWLVVSITLHELGHGWAAVKRGDSTPRDLGHLTWNPLVHIGPHYLILFALTGMMGGQMPVDPTRLRGKYAEAAVAFAGPLMNFSLAIVCIVGSVVCMKALGARPTWPPNSGQPADAALFFFMIGCWLNITLGLFNLLPAPPMDGSHILSNFSLQYRALAGTTGGQFGGMMTYILGFLIVPWIMWNLSPRIWRAAVDGLLSLLGGP
jgi:Zn-dependent protease